MRFLPDLDKMDKKPNFDGNLTIGSPSASGKKMLPLAMFRVQVKTLPGNFENQNTRGTKSQYKYSCDASIFHTVIVEVTRDPALLFLVDFPNKHAFWKYLSPEYCSSLIRSTKQGSCTVYFSDEDMIDSLDRIYDNLLAIKEGRYEKEYIIAQGLNDKLRERLIDGCHRLNNIFDDELRFVKSALFSDVRQLGFSCSCKDNRIMLKIFKAVEADDGNLVRSFDFEETAKKTRNILGMESDDLMAYSRSENEFDLDYIIDNFINETIKQYMGTFHLNTVYLTDEMLREIAFYFLDSLAKRFLSLRSSCKSYAYYEKNEVTLEELQSLFRALYEADLLYLEEEKGSTAVRNCEAIVTLDPMSYGRPDELSVEIESYFHKALTTPMESPRCNIELSGSYPYRLVQSAIDELAERGALSVSRLWPTPDLPKGLEEYLSFMGDSPNSILETQIPPYYSRELHYSTLRTLVGYWKRAYARIARQVFSNTDKELFPQDIIVLYVDPSSRSSQIVLDEFSGDRFDIKLYEGSLPTSDKLPKDCKSRHWMSSEIDFEKLPLYSLVDNLIVERVKKKYHIRYRNALGMLHKHDVKLWMPTTGGLYNAERVGLRAR